MSPSALTRTIQRIELELGSKLFERDHRGAVLTAEGERFRAYARDILDKWQEFQDTRSQDTLEARLVLFCSVTGGHRVLPPILRSFRARYPEVHVDTSALEPEAAADLVIAALRERGIIS